MTHIPDDIRTCTHCGIQVSHFTTKGTHWTPWRHVAPCQKQCDPGGCETMGDGHLSMTDCADPKCPVVLAQICARCGKAKRDHFEHIIAQAGLGHTVAPIITRLYCTMGEGTYQTAEEAKTE